MSERSAEEIAESVKLIELIDRAVAALGRKGEVAGEHHQRIRAQIIEEAEAMDIHLPSVHHRRTPADECALNGHEWAIVEEMGTGPVQLTCSTCGDSLTVLSADQRQAVSSARSVVERFSTVWETYGGVEVEPMIETLRTIR